jgi:hypothetical protein
MTGKNFTALRDRKTGGMGLDSSGSTRIMGEKRQIIARSGSGPLGVGQPYPPDPEVVEKASRRRFTAEYKPNTNMYPFLVPACNGFLLGQSSPG